MYSDPKLLIAGLCLLALALIVALAMRVVRRRNLEQAIAPRPQAATVMGKPFATLANVAPGAGNQGSKVISIIHDFGHPQGHQTDERRYLSTREAFEILAEIRSVGSDTPVDIILHTPGGEAFACELIATALRERRNTTAYVPYCAMSAGTIIALATEKIVMGKYACLGPIDTQFFGFPIESFTRLLKEKPIQNIEDFTVLLGYLAEKEMKTARSRACELLNKNHFGKDDACQLTDFLVSGDMPHSEQIGRDRAIELGVNIASGDCPPAVYDAVEEKLRIFQSMDMAQGPGIDFQTKPPELGSAQHAPLAAYRSPTIMWRKP